MRIFDCDLSIIRVILFRQTRLQGIFYDHSKHFIRLLSNILKSEQDYYRNVNSLTQVGYIDTSILLLFNLPLPYFFSRYLCFIFYD